MSILWGSWDGHLRVGIDVSQSPSTVTSSTSSVTLTWKFYVQNDGYGFADPQTLNLSGAVGSEAVNYTMTVSSGTTLTKLVATRTSNKTTSFTSSVTSTSTATVSGAFNGATPTKSRTWTTAQRPYYVPAAPSGVSITTASNGTTFNASWTRNPTSSAPYSSQTIAYRYDDAGTGYTSWKYVTISSTATSYSFTNQPAGRWLEFAVRANNSSGSSSYAGYVVTAATPKAPSAVSAAIDAGGTSITVTITGPPTKAHSTARYFAIERSVNGGAYSEVLAQGTLLYDGGSTNTVKQWQDTSPGAGTNTYRVRSYITATYTLAGGLYSGYTTGNTVSTIVAPLAPSNLTHVPAGTVDWNQWVTLEWQHNDGGDGAPQSGVQIDYSTNGGVNWTNLVDNSSWTNEWIIITSGFTNGVDYLFRVRTMGIASAGWGAWSANEAVTGSTTPTVTLQANNPPATVSTLPVPVEWTYQQDESSPQAQWQAKIVRTSDSVQVSYLTGTTETTTSFSGINLVDGVTYDLSVRALSGDGRWSEWATQEITVDLLPPAAIDVDPIYDECTGTVALTLTPQEPVGGVTVTTQAAMVERQIGGGAWVTLIENIVVPATLLDVLPITNADNTYRITSISDTPTYFENTPVVVAGTDGVAGAGLWGFLNYGDGFQNVLRVKGYLKANDSLGRSNAAQPFSGRQKPVGFVGENTDWAVSVEAVAFYTEPCPVEDTCRYDSPPEDWRAAAKESEIVCYRDHTGRRLFGLLSGMSVGDETPGVASISFTVTETDFVEVAGEIIEEA